MSDSGFVPVVRVVKLSSGDRCVLKSNKTKTPEGNLKYVTNNARNYLIAMKAVPLCLPLQEVEEVLDGRRDPLPAHEDGVEEVVHVWLEGSFGGQ